MLIKAEIVYATEDRQELDTLQLSSGTTVAEAIELSTLGSVFPGEPLDSCPTGIWGRRVERTQVVKDGDRIELYRELQKDPRDARRDRALAERSKFDLTR